MVLDDKYRDTPRDVHVPFRCVILIDEYDTSKPCQCIDEFRIWKATSFVSSKTWMIDVLTHGERDLDITVAVSMSSSCLSLRHLDEFSCHSIYEAPIFGAQVESPLYVCSRIVKSKQSREVEVMYRECSDKITEPEALFQTEFCHLILRSNNALRGV